MRSTALLILCALASKAWAESPVADRWVDLPSLSSWNIQEKRSPLDDSPEVYANLADPQSGSILVLRCKSHKTDAGFANEARFFGVDPVKVTTRIDSAKAKEVYWKPAGGGGQGTFASDPVPFIKSLPNGGRLFIRAVGNAESIDGTFDLADVGKVRDKIAKACRWP